MNSIARQIDRWDLIKLEPQDKKMATRKALKNKRYLIFIDNIETSENIHTLILDVKELEPFKVLITSRKRVQFDFVYSLSLNPLNVSDTGFFITEEARRKSIPALNSTDGAILDKIHTATGGAPLAIKLVVAQAKFLDIDIILANLENAGTSIYPYIFQKSWEHLSTSSRQLLIYIGRTVMSTVSWEELNSSSVFDTESDLTKSLTELISYSLLDAIYHDNSIRYGIHQLTRYFVNSDLPKYWEL